MQPWYPASLNYAQGNKGAQRAHSLLTILTVVYFAFKNAI